MAYSKNVIALYGCNNVLLNSYVICCGVHAGRSECLRGEGLSDCYYKQLEWLGICALFLQSIM